MNDVLLFDRKEVSDLLTQAKTAKEHYPTFDQLYDPAYRFDEKEPDEDHLAKQDEVDLTKIPWGLQLVSDRGVYLMSNARIPGKEQSKPKVIYAEGLNPEIDDGWYTDKRIAMGGDDQVIFIPGNLVEAELAKGSGNLAIAVEHNNQYVTAYGLHAGGGTA